MIEPMTDDEPGAGEPQVLQDAESAYEALKYLLESLLTRSDYESALEDLERLYEPTKVLRGLEDFKAVALRVAGYRSTDDVRCRKCTAVFAQAGFPEVQNLLGMAMVASRHECREA